MMRICSVNEVCRENLDRWEVKVVVFVVMGKRVCEVEKGGMGTIGQKPTLFRRLKTCG